MFLFAMYVLNGAGFLPSTIASSKPLAQDTRQLSTDVFVCFAAFARRPTQGWFSRAS